MNTARTLAYGCFLCVFISQNSHASAFSLYTESNGEAVGNFAAGIAAEINDASTGWYNPAGLSLMHHDQLVLGGVGVLPYTQLSGNTLYTTPNPLTPSQPFLYSQTFSHLEGARNALVPSLHVAHPLGPNTAFGLSIVTPFGLSTDWDVTSPVRYEGTYSKLVTLDVAPELGGRLTDTLAAGLGLDLEYATVTFNSVLGAPAVLASFDDATTPPNTLDSLSYNHGTSFGTGFHAGLLFHTNAERTRVGINYQSPIAQQFTGTSQLSGRLASPNLNAFEPLASNPNAVSRSDQLFSNQISLPSITTLSGYQALDERTALLGSLVYTTWNSFDTIKLYNVAAVAADQDGNISQALTNVVNLENYRNTWRFAAGANYQLLDTLLLRIGGGYEETPTNNIDRDVRLPDSGRYALSVGAHYQLLKPLGLDFGYTHLFVQPTRVTKTDQLHANQFQVNANVNSHANLAGAQLVWSLD